MLDAYSNVAVTSVGTTQTLDVTTLLASMAAMKARHTELMKDQPEVLLFMASEWHAVKKAGQPTEPQLPPFTNMKLPSSTMGIPVHVALTREEYRSMLYNLVIIQKKRVGFLQKNGMSLATPKSYPTDLTEDHEL